MVMREGFASTDTIRLIVFMAASGVIQRCYHATRTRLPLPERPDLNHLAGAAERSMIWTCGISLRNARKKFSVQRSGNGTRPRLDANTRHLRSFTTNPP